MSFRALFGALALCLSACASPAVREPVFANPEWIVRTSPDLFARYYPHEANMQGVDGRVVLDCIVNLDTTLDCDVAEETPTDWGFGAAALEISSHWRVRPATRDGVPMEGGRLRVPLAFRVV
ncbi:MAG: energy transducer TonB [Terricaulis sp.]|nr:energy transducer TonB [Terricaulis sp.]